MCVCVCECVFVYFHNAYFVVFSLDFRKPNEFPNYILKFLKDNNVGCIDNRFAHVCVFAFMSFKMSLIGTLCFGSFLYRII